MCCRTIAAVLLVKALIFGLFALLVYLDAGINTNFVILCSLSGLIIVIVIIAEIVVRCTKMEC